MQANQAEFELSSGLMRELAGPMAWRADSVSESDWKLSLPDACVEEILGVVAQLAREPMPMLALSPTDYELPECSVFFAQVRRKLELELGVIVIDRLPIEQMSSGDRRRIFWLLGSLVGRPVSQSIHGEMMVSVRDTGQPKRVGIRGFRTNYPQRPHIDNSFNHCPPDFVSLLSLTKAREGGVSHFVSFLTVLNEMQRLHPELVPRLFQPFYQDRQGDFRPGESQTVSFPMFTYDDALRCRYTHFTIPAGYATAGVVFDDESKAAFEAVSGIVEDPALRCSFTIEPGQLQIVNNRTIGHGRGPYVDHADPVARRHLLRLWHRDAGRRAYGG